MCEGHLRRPLCNREARVCVCVSECVWACPCGSAVAKGMPWLRGASQTADGFSLEVAAPLSFIRADRPRQCLPVQLTGPDSWGAGTAGACDGWEALPIDPSARCVFKWGKKRSGERCWLAGWKDGVDRLEAMNYIWTQSVLRAARAPCLPAPPHPPKKTKTSDSTHHPHSQTLRTRINSTNTQKKKNRRTAFNILNPEKSSPLPCLPNIKQLRMDGWRRSHLFCPSNESRALRSAAKTASDKAPQAASSVLDIQALLLFI